jgi:sugar/nucleoside kinase (ribokinase family)
VTDPVLEVGIAVVGDAAWDLTFVVTRRGTDEKSVSTASHRGAGGTGANAAAAAAQLGSPVHLFATVGSDAIADVVVADLESSNIDIRGVARRDGLTSTVVIVISPDGREVIVDPGVGHEFDQLDVASVLGHRLVYLSAFSLPVVASVVAARTRRHTVIGSIEARALDEWGNEWIPVLSSLDVLIVNQAAVAAIDDQLGGISSLSTYAPREGPDIVVTRGTEGAELVGRDCSRTYYPAIEVEALDATGAGDCLGGALGHFLLGGMALSDAVRLANVAAGLSTSRLGAQSVLLDEATVLRAAELSALPVHRSANGASVH